MLTYFLSCFAPVVHFIAYIPLQQTYFYKHEDFIHKNFPKARQIGWLAEEVEAAWPELVEVDAEGYKHVAYGRATVVLAEAMKELKATISEEFEAKLRAVEERMAEGIRRLLSVQTDLVEENKELRRELELVKANGNLRSIE